MKHIFIINPAAGKQDNTDFVKAAIKEAGLDIDYEIYRTKAPGDATEYVRNRCQSGKEIRFYSCGGDGTFNEVASGVVGFDNASVTVFPCGSGNDFIKYYGTAEDFSDIKALVNGSEVKIDIMESCGKYSINVINFGFDTVVLKTMAKVKRKKFIGGKNAYTTGIITALLKGMKTHCTIKADGKQLGSDTMLICTIANGKYIGGKYKCAPFSLNDDGLMEVCLVNPISRLQFVKLIKYYEKGTHLSDPRFDGIVNYVRATSIEVEAAPGKTLGLALDGELTYTDKFNIRILKQAIRFVVPSTLADCCEKEKGEELLVH